MTGMRRGEALALKWQDVNMADGEAHVRRNRVPSRGGIVENAPKTAAGERVVPLDAITVAALGKWQRRQYDERAKAESAWHDTGYLFTYEDGRPLDPRWVSRLFVRAVARVNAEPRGAGLPPLSIHGLRHTFATIALSRGAQPLVVSRILGHTNIRVTLDTYAGVLKESRDDAAQLVAAAVAGSMTGLATNAANDALDEESVTKT
jgi:integrase